MIVDMTPATGGAPVRMMIDEVLFGRGRTGVALTFAIAYRFRAAADAVELRLAKALNSRIRV